MIETLREMLYRPPSRELFAGLVAFLDGHAGSPDLPLAVSYCRSHVEAWPQASARTLQPTRDQLDRWLNKGRAPSLLPLVYRLDLSGRRLGRWDVKALLPSLHAARLHALDLSRNDLGSGGLRALATSRYVGHLRELDVSASDVDADGVELLLESTSLSGLRALKLAGNAIGADGLARLCRGESLTHIEELDLGDCGVDVDGARVLAHSRRAPQLERLHLGHNPLGLEGLEVLLATTALDAIEGLGLPGLGLGDEGVEILEDARAEGRLASVRELDVRRNGLTLRGAQSLATWVGLEELRAGVNPLGDRGVAALVDGEGLGEGLVRLDLSQVGMTSGGLEALAAAESLGGLRELVLASFNGEDKESLWVMALTAKERAQSSWTWAHWAAPAEPNAIGSRGAQALAAAPHLGQLRRLDLRNNKVGRSGVDALLHSLHLRSLRELDLHGNLIGTLDIDAVLADLHRDRREASVSAADALDAVRQDLGDCQRCGLCGSRGSIVYGAGDPNAAVVLIGECPGAAEDATGLPFVGRSREVVDEVLGAVGLERSEVYLTNLVKCRPPPGRKPLPAEVETCLPFAWRQIGCIDPQVVVTLGRAASQAVVGLPARLSAMRGNWYMSRGVRVMPTWHPAYVLREPDRGAELKADLQEVVDALSR